VAYVFEMVSSGVPNFMKFGADVQAILRFCLRNLRGCSVGSTGGRDL
jgi:hypothetical protein